MEIIVGNRGSGKTTKLIETCAKNGGYIVCRSGMEAEISDRARKLGYNIPHPLCYKEFLEGKYYGKNIKLFHIDDTDALLAYISKGVPIHAITINRED